MTSNLGSEILLENNTKESKDQVMNIVKGHFRPEFLNRIDEIVMFNPLDREVQIKIVDKMLKEFKKRLLNNNIKVEFTSDLKKYIIDNSYNTTYGARPIKRYIQKNIETIVAKAIITSEIEPHKSYVIDWVGDKVVINKL